MTRVTISRGNEWHRNIALQYARDNFIHGEMWRIKCMLALNHTIEVNGWQVTQIK